MANLEQLRKMSNEEFWDWLFERTTKTPITGCRSHTDCLECWEEQLGDLVERSPALIEYLARRFCPPTIEKDGGER